MQNRAAGPLPIAVDDPPRRGPAQAVAQGTAQTLVGRELAGKNHIHAGSIELAQRAVQA
jgi:hypothetical protein